jgi:hypothetical protein
VLAMHVPGRFAAEKGGTLYISPVKYPHFDLAQIVREEQVSVLNVTFVAGRSAAQSPPQPQSGSNFRLPDSAVQRDRGKDMRTLDSVVKLEPGQDKSQCSICVDDVIRWLDQAESETEGQVADTHHAPVQPNQYLQFRVAKALGFYQGRIPHCSRMRNITHALLLLGSIAAATLAFLNMVIWSGAVSIVTAAITAYAQFHGTESKINRYSFTVHALEELIFWWQTLPQIDRSVVSNIDRLVLSCEALLQKEQQAWRTASQSMRLMLERAKHAEASAADPSDPPPT